jgi:hypothetical protein
MTALSAAARRQRRNIGNAIYYDDIAVGTGAVIYQGALVGWDGARALPANNATSIVAFLGMADFLDGSESVTGNTAGTVKCRVVSNIEVLLDAASALTATYIGSDAAAEDDNQVTTGSDAGTAALQIRVGRITQIEGGDAWVHLNNIAGQYI